MRKRRVNYRNLAITCGAMLLFIILVVFLISSAFKACTGSQEQTNPAQTTQTDSSQGNGSVITLGNKKDGTEINLDNQSGQAIVSFKVRNSDSGDFGENLLGDSRIKNKSTAKWYVKTDDSTINVEIKLANYTTFVLHEIPLSKFNGLVTIKYKDGIGYLEYKTKESENTLSTYQEELKYKDQTDTSQSSGQQNTTQPSQSVENSENAANTDSYDSGITDDNYYDEGTYTDDSADDDYSDNGYTEDGTVYEDNNTGEEY